MRTFVGLALEGLKGSWGHPILASLLAPSVGVVNAAVFVYNVLLINQTSPREKKKTYGRWVDRNKVQAVRSSWHEAESVLHRSS